MPKKFGISRQKLVGQTNGFLLDIAENSPWDLIAGKADTAAVDGLGIGPKPTALRAFEKLARFDVYSLALAAGGKRENERKQLGKRELAAAGKVRGRLSDFRINISGDKIKKRFNGVVQLAWFFKAGSVPWQSTP